MLNLNKPLEFLQQLNLDPEEDFQCPNLVEIEVRKEDITRDRKWLPFILSKEEGRGNKRAEISSTESREQLQPAKKKIANRLSLSERKSESSSSSSVSAVEKPAPRLEKGKTHERTKKAATSAEKRVSKGKEKEKAKPTGKKVTSANEGRSFSTPSKTALSRSTSLQEATNARSSESKEESEATPNKGKGKKEEMDYRKKCLSLSHLLEQNGEPTQFDADCLGNNCLVAKECLIDPKILTGLFLKREREFSFKMGECVKIKAYEAITL